MFIYTRSCTNTVQFQQQLASLFELISRMEQKNLHEYKMKVWELEAYSGMEITNPFLDFSVSRQELGGVGLLPAEDAGFPDSSTLMRRAAPITRLTSVCRLGRELTRQP